MTLSKEPPQKPGFYKHNQTSGVFFEKNIYCNFAFINSTQASSHMTFSMSPGPSLPPPAALPAADRAAAYVLLLGEAAHQGAAATPHFAKVPLHCAYDPSVSCKEKTNNRGRF